MRLNGVALSGGQRSVGFGQGVQDLQVTVWGQSISLPFSKINSATISKFDTFAHDLHDFFATGSRVR